ncbi:flagellar basal body L-ring protein FlgH [Luteimonas sp. FCS-9]|uniref:flagellar basal body L-ring protein FlgH n=1 Tax=Luteimonas sp. FCS-9 TaxID=1547516 RepID=UPI00063EC5CA|nr:flagellar basal body L-ring protein FlgH [Luteimonas sp. FCS-9]KLJ02732.1 flagellar basal body L-ring protein [Luteimonas sp. FCS-9]
MSARLPTVPRALAPIALTALLGGCVAAGDVRPYPPLAPIQPVVAAPAYATQGAIYQAGGGGLSLFADKRARDVGDLITIQLVESTIAQTNAATQVGKESGIAIAAPNLFGAPVTVGGREVLGASATGTRDFDGSGRSTQSNRLQGSITVTVVQRLPNGNLVVEGSKNLRLNQGNELVQVQGIVRPADIAPDNSVPSGRVADARIVYGGRGAIAQSNAMGWLGRFFNSRLYPY